MREHIGDVAIFWDYENCPAPAGSSGWDTVKEIRRVAQVYGSIKVFKAYLELPEQSCSPESRSLQLRSELQASGVSLTDCPHNGRKDVADKMMLVDMMAHAIDNPVPLTYVLISGDRDFAYALAVLRLRCYQVVLVTHPTAHNSLKSQATTCIDWSIILGRIASYSRELQLTPLAKVPLDAQSERTLPLRSPFRGSVLPSEQESHARGRAGVDTRGYNQRQRHWSISSGESQSLTSTHEGTAQTAYFSAQEDSPLLTPLPLTSHTNTGDEVNSRFPTSSRSAFDRLVLTMGDNIPKCMSDNSPPAASGLLAHEVVQFPEITPVFSPPTSSSSGTAVSPTPNLASSVLPAALPPPPLPPAFRPLVNLLKDYQKKGILRPLRSNVALELEKQADNIYKQAKVDKFSQYVALAERSKIVALGGVKSDAWMVLRAEWYS